MVASRLDISEGRIAFLELALRTRITPRFGDRPPARSTARRAGVDRGARRELAARTVRSTGRSHQVLDYAEADPNRHDTRR